MRNHSPQRRVTATRPTRFAAPWALLAAVACAVSGGCAAFTNPVANGVPVRLIPDDLLAPSREGYESVDLTMLRQPPPEQFVLDSGDTLGVYIEGVIGDESTPPPVNLPASAEMPPAIGYPFPVRGDGTISLPLVGAVRVAGMTIEQAEQEVVRAYLQKQIVREEDYRIIVTLLRPRTVRVLVVREDNSTPGVTVTNQSLRGLGSTSTTIGGGAGATGNTLELPVYQNDVLNALASTGGLPTESSTEEVLVYRGYSRGDVIVDAVSGETAPADASTPTRVIRIPTRVRCGQSLRVAAEDIVLQDGDIVRVKGREPEFFYTGGLLPAGEQLLPWDYDLTVLEAVLRTNGPLVNGGINSSNLNGNIVGAGVGNPSPSQLTVLRRTPGGQQVNIYVDLSRALRDPRENILVKADDILLLQETRDEALTRYFFNSVFRMDFFFRTINRNDAQGSATFVVP